MDVYEQKRKFHLSLKTEKHWCSLYNSQRQYTMVVFQTILQNNNYDISTFSIINQVINEILTIGTKIKQEKLTLSKCLVLMLSCSIFYFYLILSFTRTVSSSQTVFFSIALSNFYFTLTWEVSILTINN